MAGPCEVWLLRQWPQWVSRFAPGPNSFELPLRCRVGRLGRVFTNSRFAECRTDASSYLHLCTNRRNLSYELKLLAACKCLVGRRALSFLLALSGTFSGRRTCEVKRTGAILAMLAKRDLKLACRTCIGDRRQRLVSHRCWWCRILSRPFLRTRCARRSHTKGHSLVRGHSRATAQSRIGHSRWTAQSRRYLR